MPWAVWILLAVLLPACTSTVRGPGEVADPVPVLLLQEALHQGIVLPATDGTLVEFGFGDWDWYALGRERWDHALPTVLWPTEGALCRRLWPVGDRAALERRAPWLVLQSVTVSATRAAALRDELEAAFTGSAWPPRFRPDLPGMAFVPCASGYWFGHTCSDAVAGWLRQLDCRVAWVPIRTGLRVR